MALLEHRNPRCSVQEQEMEKLRRELGGAVCDRRDLYVSRLLGGGYFQTAQDAKNTGREYGMEFSCRYYVLLAARPEAWGELFTGGSLDRRDSGFILRNTMENGLPGIVHAADIQGKMICIVNWEQMPDMGLDELVQAAQQILEVLETEFGITVTVTISRVYEDVLSLPQAMQDINSIYDYLALLDEDRPITTYEELTHIHMMPSSASYLELETRLLGCIRASDFAGGNRVLHELIQGEFGDAKPTIDTVRFRVYGVVNTLLYLIEDIRDAVGNEVVDRIDPGPRLTSARSLKEIVEVMDDIFAQLESFTAQKRESLSSPWAQEIMPYVDEHFRDPNLSVSSVADHFGLSSTYCSKAFRERFGIRLLDYIQQQRLKAAKSLLVTGKSLDNIAKETGFSTTLTLSRTIKRYEGTTPNRLREYLIAEQAKQ